MITNISFSTLKKKDTIWLGVTREKNIMIRSCMQYLFSLPRIANVSNSKKQYERTRAKTKQKNYTKMSTSNPKQKERCIQKHVKKICVMDICLGSKQNTSIALCWFRFHPHSSIVTLTQKNDSFSSCSKSMFRTVRKIQGEQNKARKKVCTYPL